MNKTGTSSGLARYLPILNWLPKYRLSQLRQDLPAGLAIWAVTVPQGMAYAGIANVPPVMGLYTVPLSMIAYAIFGTSRTLSVGPDSATFLISAATVGALAAQGTDQFFVLMSAMALLAGAFYILFGLLRMGWAANFLAQPVLKGFLQGLAVIVIVSQMPALLGVQGSGGHVFEQLWTIVQELPKIQPATLAVGLASLAALILLKRFAPKAPGAFITVIIAVLAATLLGLGDAGVDLVGTVEAGLPPVGFPQVSLSDLAALVPGALAIVLVGYAESLAVAETSAETTGEKIDSNQELIAVGASNLGAGLSSGFIVAGSLSRGAVILGARGRSQVVGLINAGLTILTLLFLMPFFKNLPQATLAALVILAMFGMLDFSYFRDLRRTSRPEFRYAIAAFVGELVLGVLAGVLMGVILSLLALIRRATRPGTAVLGKMPGEEAYLDIHWHPEAQTYPGLLIYRFDAAMIFPNATYFASQMQREIAAAETPVREVLVDASTLNDMDTTAADVLVKLQADLSGRGIGLSFADLEHPVREFMHRAGVDDKLGADRLYESISDGVRTLTENIETRRDNND